MPLRKAHYYVLAMLALTFVAFWPGYFSKLPEGKSAWHVHAIGAVLWVILLIVQSWSINSGRRALHRTSGMASFLLFPLFLVGGMMAIQAEALTLAGGLDSPENRFIGPFGFFDPLANLGFAVLFHGGLKYRRNVQIHSRYMVATVMFIIAPLIWRLLDNYVAFFDSSSPETLYRFSYSMAVGNTGAITIAYFLYRQAPKYGRPFLIAIGFILAQQILFETAGRVDAWAWLFSRLAHVNSAILLAATAVASLAIAWHGWNSGKRMAAPKATTA
jgi:uncharacterized membrane protein YozB (DUF420 family)